jgi:hypothetical protein
VNDRKPIANVGSGSNSHPVSVCAVGIVQKLVDGLGKSVDITPGGTRRPDNKANNVLMLTRLASENAVVGCQPSCPRLKYAILSRRAA